MLFLYVAWLCVAVCADIHVSMPAGSTSEGAVSASAPGARLTIDKLLKTSQPHIIGGARKDAAFLVQVIRCLSNNESASAEEELQVNTTVERLSLPGSEENSHIALNITVQRSTVLNHTFYVEGYFTASSDSIDVDFTRLLESEWAVRMSCYDDSSRPTLYSEAVIETLKVSQGPQMATMPREHAANPLNLLPGSVVLPLQGLTESTAIQILPISGPDPFPFQISSGNLVVRDNPELRQTIGNYELVLEAQSDNGSTSWAYTNIEMLKCPCKNGGVCVPPDFTSLDTVRCTCTSQFQGNRCHISTWYELRPANLTIHKKINEGGYGRIYTGKMNEEYIVVKRILFEDGDDHDELLRKFLQECKLLKQLSSEHPHIVGFRGAYYDKKTEEPILVMEKMKENLRNFIEIHEDEALWHRQIEIALSVIRAVRQLHTRRPLVIHRDLTTKNVMFSYDGLVKLGDFGQSVIKLKDDQFFTEYRPGAIGYMSPESLIKPPHYNERHDIFCFGIVLLELVTFQRPKRTKKNLGVLSEVERRSNIIEKIPNGHPLEPVILACLKDNPEDRPDVIELHLWLSALAEGFTEDMMKDNSTLQWCGNGTHPQSKVLHADLATDDPTTTTTTTTTILHKQMVYVCGPNGGVVPAPDTASTPQSEMRGYSLADERWTTLPPPPQYASSCAVIRNRVNLIGGKNLSTDKPTNMLSTWYEEEGQWKQVLPPMPTGRALPTVISHDNLLLVTGGVAEDGSTVINTTDVLDLITMEWTTPAGLKLPVPLVRHHLTVCGEYLYLVGGAVTSKAEPHSTQTTEPEHNTNTHAWRAKWSDVKDHCTLQATPQPNIQSVWKEIADPPVPTHTQSSGGSQRVCTDTERDSTSLKSIFIYDESHKEWRQVGQLSSGRYSRCTIPPKSSIVVAATDEDVSGGSLANEFEGNNKICSGSIEVYCSCESI